LNWIKHWIGLRAALIKITYFSSNTGKIGPLTKN